LLIGKLNILINLMRKIVGLKVSYFALESLFFFNITSELPA